MKKKWGLSQNEANEFVNSCIFAIKEMPLLDSRGLIDNVITYCNNTFYMPGE